MTHDIIYDGCLSTPRWGKHIARVQVRVAGFGYLAERILGNLPLQMKRSTKRIPFIEEGG